MLSRNPRWKYRCRLNTSSSLIAALATLALGASACTPAARPAVDDDAAATATPAETPIEATPVAGDDDPVTNTPAGGDDDVTMPSSGDDDTTPPPGDDDTTPPSGDDDTTFPPTPPGGDDDTPPATPPGDDDTPPATPPGDDDTGAGEPTPVPPKPPSAWWTGSMLVSDTGAAALTLIRMSDSALLWNYNAYDSMPTRCNPGRPCQMFEARHHVTDDRDYVDFIMSSGSYFQTGAYRLDMAEPALPVYSLTGFDWSGVSSGCTLPPQNTCGADASVLPAQCYVQFGHGMQILKDDPAAKKVTMVITDTQSRILQVSLDYNGGNACGKVDWVLNSESVGWDPACPPNDVQYLEDGGNPYLLVTCRNLALTGAGQVQLFKGRRLEGAAMSWERRWEFPPASSSSMPYLNIPHHTRLHPRASGGYDMVYAHSDGLANAWGDGDKGTMGSAQLSSIESAPDYLADEAAGLNTQQPLFNFLKSIEPLSGGARLVVDGGIFNPSVMKPNAIYVIDPVELRNDSKVGYWTADHSQQNLTEVGGAIEATYMCLWNGLYGAYWLDPNEYGSTMRSLFSSPGYDCELAPLKTSVAVPDSRR